jgi:hypothetical protein
MGGTELIHRAFSELDLIEFQTIRSCRIWQAWICPPERMGKSRCMASLKDLTSTKCLSCSKDSGNKSWGLCRADQPIVDTAVTPGVFLQQQPPAWHGRRNRQKATIFHSKYLNCIHVGVVLLIEDRIRRLGLLELSGIGIDCEHVIFAFQPGLGEGWLGCAIGTRHAKKMYVISA